MRFTLINKNAALLRPLKNKKGFTFIEAIAVVAIMGILAVVIGSLVGSGTTAYMREKNKAAAKEISAITSKEIARKMTSAYEIYLINGDLPEGEFKQDNKTYRMTNVPFGEYYEFANSFYSDNGVLMFLDKGEDELSYFSDTESKNSAFYGLFSIDMHVQAIADGTGKFLSLTVFIDVYKDGKLMYDDPGRVVVFRESSTATASIIHSVKDDKDAVSHDDVGEEKAYAYIDQLPLAPDTLFTHIYYIDQTTANG